jgi:uncharacterized membrane protein
MCGVVSHRGVFSGKLWFAHWTAVVVRPLRLGVGDRMIFIIICITFAFLGHLKSGFALIGA